jgi:hypothetical protein
MNRFVLAFLDLRAQWRLFFAEVRYQNAVRVLAEAGAEQERALLSRDSFGRDVQSASEDARVAALKVRRQQLRSAAGLR